MSRSPENRPVGYKQKSLVPEGLTVIDLRAWLTQTYRDSDGKAMATKTDSRISSLHNTDKDLIRNYNEVASRGYELKKIQVSIKNQIRSLASHTRVTSSIRNTQRPTRRTKRGSKRQLQDQTTVDPDTSPFILNEIHPGSKTKLTTTLLQEDKNRRLVHLSIRSPRDRAVDQIAIRDPP
ncbi:hypothetical protein BJ508DRAFT_315663 [Ascobolus immersus RN42]|uniref:Uncharacterized protein n=1 Tax=Ascobolus immersus RN42 TaxID=1160509 RepID=A0A3N4H9V8_ASCIM|nr:hypothetical protein BJ508DRAFT_315663 [Ascobolus immersus RN42]